MSCIFQILPYHISEKVVGHILGRRHPPFDDVEYGPDDDIDLLLPLLWVCRSFRLVVYKKYCARYAIDLERYPWSHKPKWPEWPWHLRKRNHLGHHLVKQLDVAVDLQSICSGSAIKKLSRRPFNGNTFPRVRAIDVVVVWSTAEEIELFMEDDQEERGATYPPKTEANVGALVQQIKRLIPVVNNISVKHIRYHDSMLQKVGRFSRNLAARFFRLPKRAHRLVATPHVPLEPSTDSVHSLVRISYAFRGETASCREQLLQIVQRNAPTLRHLSLKAPTFVDISGLLQNADGGYVTYRHLNTLALSLCDSSSKPMPLVAGDIVIFPSLWDLTILKSYPFGDDVPFRGNAATLETMSIAAARDVCSMLRRHNVFTAASHPKLRRVSVTQPSDGILSYFESVTAYMQFVLAIAPGASERQFLGTHSWEGLSAELRILQNHANIQVLALPELVLDFWEVTSLIEWLPVLSDLHCQSTLLGVVYEDATPEVVDARLKALRDLKRVRFRRWRLGCRIREFLGLVVPCVLQLALVCPNFDCVSIPRSIHWRLMERLEDDIESGEYAGNEPRLRRLLSNSS
ncbi:hypothetical protein GGI20_000616 [Coemansia sp. BCRC 34301]|nr:hypothetical protein GGI20_000616 [Coemansia sp. BCRC 34301]